MLNIYVRFETEKKANEFYNVLVENERQEEFARSTSRSFAVGFPDDAPEDECQDEVINLMWQLGYVASVDYVVY